MHRIFTIAAFATVFISGLANPSFAEGDYVAGPTASQAWKQPHSRTLLAGSHFSGERQLAGGDDQYVAGPTASPAWKQGDSRSPLASTGPLLTNFDFSTQGN
ncbi:hypothetical protein [Roseomonas xinghualingensis]|uniref:hypothetical protein n=1 Tax=Roseomonas xinghualingensis TaxID=2986475 RepID=UPI0021F11808|nr:hypothetical protein [Roseomonas sp. SXEYE001]MCV4206315.1 hypothetical protein [Roseomonas sp. SXEYE001]